MLFENVERVLNEDQQINAPIPSLRAEWRHFERENPFDSMSDREFRINHRLSKASVLKLADLINPFMVTDERSHSLTPLQKLCLTLHSSVDVCIILL